MGFHHIDLAGRPGICCIAHAESQTSDELSVSTPLTLGLQACATTSGTFAVFLEIKFRSSYSCSEHFIDQASPEFEVSELARVLIIISFHL